MCYSKLDDSVLSFPQKLTDVKVPVSKTLNPRLLQRSFSMLASQSVDKEAANHCEVDQLSGLSPKRPIQIKTGVTPPP